MVSRSEDHDRPRGILSSADRKFLVASDAEREENYSRSARTQRERAVRERTANALMDFQLLFDYLPDEDIEKVFQNPSNEERSGMIATLAFIYRGSRDGLLPHPKITYDFERLLKHAVQRVEYDPDGPQPNARYIEVTFENDAIKVHPTRPEDIDFETIGEKIEAGETEDLTRTELLWFFWYYNHIDALDPYLPAREHRRNMDLLGEVEDREEHTREVYGSINERKEDREQALERQRRAEQGEKANEDEQGTAAEDETD